MQTIYRTGEIHITISEDQFYTFYEDNGELKAVDTETGEILDTTVVTLPVGSIAYTPQQQRHYKERKAKEQLIEIWRTEGEKFVFANTQNDLQQLKPETVGRLIFLSTFLSYDDNVLYQTQKTPLSIKTLMQVLKLSKATFSRFCKEVMGKYLFICKDKKSKEERIILNKQAFIRGSLLKYKFCESWQKLFIFPIRELYEILPTVKHRYLGYIFKMIPYINIEYNILCLNPYETDLEKIEPISFDDFCIFNGYTINQRKRLLSIYSNIVFEIREHKEHFCMFVTSLNEKDSEKIFVNPNIIYRGTQKEKVEILGGFCKI